MSSPDLGLAQCNLN